MDRSLCWGSPWSTPRALTQEGGGKGVRGDTGRKAGSHGCVSKPATRVGDQSLTPPGKLWDPCDTLASL